MRYLPRIADSALNRAVTTFPVVLVEGARATGKTTSAARLVATQFRLPRDLALIQSDPEAVLGAAARPVLIDEWQLAGVDLLWTIKSMVDADPRPGSFVLTGSVEPEAYGPTYPLTGRGTRLSLRPMTRREAMGEGTGKLWLSRLLDGELARPGRHHEVTDVKVMTDSGFPAAMSLVNGAEWLRAYTSTIAERSVDERRDPVRVGRLIRVLAEFEGRAVADEQIWRAADINHATLSAYQRMLARTHIVADVPSWETNRLKRITAYPKRHLAEAALATSVARIGPTELARDPQLAGRYLESFIATQLRPECDQLGGVLSHIRTQGGEREIDFLIELAEGLVAIEVKAGVRPGRGDAKHLVWLKEQLGDRLLASILLHRGDTTFEITPGVWALPISSFWTS